MRPMVVSLIVVSLLAVPLTAAQRTQQSELLREGKLALLDGRLEKAIETLERLQERFPDGSYFWDAVFFEAQALERLHRKEDALRRYRDLVDHTADHPLREQAELSLVELSVALYEEGVDAYVEQALAALESSREALRQVAALRLSYVKDHDIAVRAVPVLKRLAASSDAEVRNQATVALLRIDPELLQGNQAGPQPSERKGLLKMVWEEEGEKVTLSFPISLARMLINALPQHVLDEIRREEGIDAGKLMNRLEEGEGRIEVEANGFKLKIWIE